MGLGLMRFLELTPTEVQDLRAMMQIAEKALRSVDSGSDPLKTKDRRERVKRTLEKLDAYTK